MNEGTIWSVIIGLGIASALIRYSFLGLLRGRDVPAVVRRALGFVPAAAFPAIFMPMIILDAEGGWAEPSRPIAGALALAVGMVSRSMFLALVIGVAAILILPLAGL